MVFIMSRNTRFPHGLRKNQITVTKTSSATLTEIELMKYKVVLISGDDVNITLPAAAAVYKGVELIISNVGTSILNDVVTSAGFNGGGVDYDTINLSPYASVFLQCDGTHWRAIASDSIEASGSTSTTTSTSTTSSSTTTTL